MGALVYNIHSETPEMKKISAVADAVNDGAVILYPTDTGFTLGCNLSNKNAIEKIRRIRGFSTDKSLTFLCDSLSNISEFAKVNNEAYKTIKRLIPGPYTFILPASREVPKFAQNPKRNTAGIRVPQHTLARLLLKDVGHPIISISAKIGDNEMPNSPDELADAFTKLVDVVVTSEKYNFLGESTVIDMTEEQFYLIRKGSGWDKISEFVSLEEATE
jgi:tRNA threonylcarbamoyl adenosine modification protein (Sua5/YciO/YrdC/YwlC family)